MTTPATPTNPSRARGFIARKVQQLRKARHWTQAELAQRLNLSQSRLSEVERGDGSFTAEQFLTILQIFNVPVSEFVQAPAERSSELQNALARLGATHLLETASVPPSERLAEPGDAVREALITAESPRLIAALAPVLVHNIDGIHLNKLRLQLSDVGLDRRLAWLVENTVAAIVSEVPSIAAVAARRPYRRAQVLLESFLAFVSARTDERTAPPDVLDAAIRSKQTLNDVLATSSPVSRRWGIVSALQPEDFADALRSAHAAHS